MPANTKYAELDSQLGALRARFDYKSLTDRVEAGYGKAGMRGIQPPAVIGGALSLKGDAKEQLRVVYNAKILPIADCWSKAAATNPYFVELRQLQEKVPASKRKKAVDEAKSDYDNELVQLLRKGLDGGFGDLTQNIKEVIILPLLAVKLRELKASQLDFAGRFVKAVERLFGADGKPA
jgi:hypothetical protein